MTTDTPITRRDVLQGELERNERLAKNYFDLYIRHRDPHYGQRLAYHRRQVKWARDQLDRGYALDWVLGTPLPKRETSHDH